MQRTITNPLIKDQVTFLTTSRESSGTRTEVEVLLAHGGGTPMHYHITFAETFIVTRGKLGLEAGGRKFYLLPAERFTVPPGMKHRFFNDSEEDLIFRVLIEPGSEGFENSLRIAYGLATDGRTNSRSVPRNVYHLAYLTAIGDSNLAGGLALLGPFFRFLARRAVHRKIDVALLRRYCRD
ncbi:MAG: cupin domain-containing protein [Mucilaginibacter polytrichastri]|nr:cupin domain-containing protein [Mucilaginibacter polytrichastri]